jgi:hypothetical protein
MSRRRLKVTTFAVALAAFCAMAGVYQVGFELWPPQAVLANGTSVPLRALEVEACFQARVIGVVRMLLSDPVGITSTAAAQTRR